MTHEAERRAAAGVAERTGVLILGTERSGTHWLGSLARGAGLGNSDEWLDRPMPRRSSTLADVRAFFEETLDHGTAGAGFCVKLFPWQLINSVERLREDFVRYCLATHRTSLIVIERRDRLRQAISLARGRQSAQWTADQASRGEPVYDFDLICRCHFQIGRSNEFWRSYVALLDQPAAHFVYEDLLDDPTPFVRHVADCMGAPAPERPESSMRVQRDDTTEDWLARFRADLVRKDIVMCSDEAHIYPRSLSNLNRLLRKRQLRRV